MRVVVVGRMPSERHSRGVGPRGTTEGFLTACRSLGALLAKHGHTLVVTSDVALTADREVVEGYVEWVGEHPSGPYEIEVVLPADTARDPFREHREHHSGLFSRTLIHSRSMEVARFRVCMESDATVLIGGGAGTERTGHVALAARRAVIPIASFGGAAADFLAAIAQDGLALQRLPSELDRSVLSQDWSPRLSDRLDAWLRRGRWGTGRDVFVVYGRNRVAQQALFELLRALDLNPLEWGALVAGTGKTGPYVGEVLAHGFATAQACVVLFTGDEVVRLGRAFAKPHERAAELQPRPNVLLEAGMALASNPDRTLIVQLGPTRALSDLAGRQFIEMDDDLVAGRQAIADRLRIAGCQVRTTGEDWLQSGDFAGAIQLARAARVPR